MIIDNKNYGTVNQGNDLAFSGISLGVIAVKAKRITDPYALEY